MVVGTSHGGPVLPQGRLPKETDTSPPPRAGPKVPFSAAKAGGGLMRSLQFNVTAVISFVLLH